MSRQDPSFSTQMSSDSSVSPPSLVELTAQKQQAITILNQCRYQIFSNKPESALAMLYNMNKRLSCTQELSTWTHLTAALAQQKLHNWPAVCNHVRNILNEIDQFESDDIHICLLEILTNLYVHSGEFTRALKTAQTLLRLLLNKEDDGALFNLYGLFGQILLKLNNNYAAEQAFKKQLELASENQAVIAHSNLTVFYSATQNQAQRYTHLSKSIELLKQCGKCSWFCLRDYAEMLSDCGYFMRALQAYERVLMLTQESGLTKEEAAACCRIVELNSKLDNYLEAWTYYLHSLSILSNLPYTTMTLNCIDGCVEAIKNAFSTLSLDEKQAMLAEICNECLKFGLHAISQQILNSLDHSLLNDQLLQMAIALNSSDKNALICLLNRSHNCDTFNLNLLLRTLIEVGEYSKASDLYSKHASFGYLETLMISCTDGSLNLAECAAMALKLDVNLHLYFLDLFSLYKFVDFCALPGPETRLHWLIFNQKTEEIEAQLDYYGDVSVVDKLLAILIGSDIEFNVDAVYSAFVSQQTSTDFDLLATLCALFYFDRPEDSLYSLEYLNFIRLQNESKTMGLDTEKWQLTKEQFFELSSFCYRFQFGRFKFAWVGDSSNLQLIFTRRYSSKLANFHESMLQIIVTNLQLLECDEMEFEQRAKEPSRFEFGQGICATVSKPLIFEVGCLLIGDSFEKERFNIDGFIHLPIQNGTFKKLASVPQVSATSVIFVDSQCVDPFFLLKNSCQPVILVIVGTEWINSKWNNLLASRTQILIQFNTADQINNKFIELVTQLLKGFEIDAEESTLNKTAFNINNKVQINCPAVAIRAQICKIIESGEKLKLENFLKESDRKELSRCQKSTLFKRILLNNDIQAIETLGEPESSILRRLFSDYYYGATVKVESSIKTKVAKLTFGDDEKLLRQSCRSQKYKYQKSVVDYEQKQESSEEIDGAKVLDVSLPF